MSNKLTSWLLFVLLCFIWGSSFILMKTSAAYLSIVQIAALRIFSASIALLPFAIIHFTKFPRQKTGTAILAGIFGNLIPAFLFAAAITKIDSSLAGILNSLTPLCVAIIAVVFFKDTIKKQKLTGIIIGFIGVCLLTLTQNNISLTNMGYSLLVVAATFSYGLNVNFVSHYLKGVHPLHAAYISLAFLSIPTGIILWLNGFMQLDFADKHIQQAVAASVLLGVVGSGIATAIFYVLVQKAGGIFASLVTYGIPFVALFWGVMDGEKVTLVEIACLLVILIGVYFANRQDKKKKEKSAGI